MSRIIFFAILLFSQMAFSQNLRDKISHFQNIFNNPGSSTEISQSSYNAGETRPKAILKGAFYIGGSDRRRELLSSSMTNQMCADDFSRIYSVYIDVDTTVSCGSNTLDYVYIGEARDGGGGSRVYNLMSYLYNDVINGSAGAVYLHCYYGVHASNTLAQMALMQFCGISKEQAKSNWDVIDIYDSLGAKGRRRQFQKIDEFNPFPEFQLTAQQRSQICH
jgi:hypothetical protein